MLGIREKWPAEAWIEWYILEGNSYTGLRNVRRTSQVREGKKNILG